MKYDILVVGVEEQGARAMAALLAAAALRLGWTVRQTEIRGTPARPGALQIHLRLADAPIASERIPKGSADLILGLEPLEALRYLSWLTPAACVVTASEPVRDMPNYPEPHELLQTLRARPHSRVFDARRAAGDAGLPRAAHVAVLGAASALLPINAELLSDCVGEAFRLKGETVVESALRAFRAGRETSEFVPRPEAAPLVG